jgi:hypothetical protein
MGDQECEEDCPRCPRIVRDLVEVQHGDQ